MLITNARIASVLGATFSQAWSQYVPVVTQDSFWVSSTSAIRIPSHQSRWLGGLRPRSTLAACLWFQRRLGGGGLPCFFSLPL
ncbi:hypothetical protein FB567DRAFT_530290, partial [Paraphoma chrysanthemicola]